MKKFLFTIIKAIPTVLVTFILIALSIYFLIYSGKLKIQKNGDTIVAIYFSNNFEITINNDVIYYRGEINQKNYESFLEKVNNSNKKITKLIINSGGGNTVYGRKIGEFIFDNKLDVEVESFCFSSCANYIFPAGKTKYIQKDAIVGFHGSEHQVFLTKNKNKTIQQQIKKELIKALTEANNTQNKDDIEKIAIIETKRSMESLKEEKLFYKKIKVDISLPILGIKSLIDKNNTKYMGFTYKIDDFKKFGVKNVIYLGKDKYFIDSNNKNKDRIFIQKISNKNIQEIKQALNINKLPLYTKDIDLFYEVIKNKKNITGEYLYKNYIKKGSVVVKDFFNRRYSEKKQDLKRYGEDMKNILPFLRENEKNIKNIKITTKELDSIYNKICSFLEKNCNKLLKNKGVYFFIGNFKQGGSAFKDGVWFDAAMIKKQNTNYKPLPPKYQTIINILFTESNLIFLITHEFMHSFQIALFNSYKEFMSIVQNANIGKVAIIEGGADFFAKTILGFTKYKKLPNQQLKINYIKNNPNIIKEFLKDISIKINTKTGTKWFYNSYKKLNIPADLGYYLGYLITEQYWKKNIKNRSKSDVFMDIIKMDKKIIETYPLSK